MDQVIKNVLLTISDVDNRLSNNRKQKNKLINSYDNKIKICKFLNKLLNYKVVFPLILVLCVINYLNFSNKLIGILVTLSIITLFNFTIVIIVSKLEPKKEVFEKIQNYNQEKKELLSKRKTYINIYNYLTNGDKSIFNNIRHRVDNTSFYNYDEFIKELWIQDDSFALNTILEMKDKEQKIIDNIKNNIYYEINSPEKKEGLTIEQLMVINNAL